MRRHWRTCREESTAFALLSVIRGPKYFESRYKFSRNFYVNFFGKYFHEAHGRSDVLNESHFKIMRKCEGKFDFFLFELHYIQKFKPNLNVQTDFIRAKPVSYPTSGNVIIASLNYQ